MEAKFFCQTQVTGTALSLSGFVYTWVSCWGWLV